MKSGYTIKVPQKLLRKTLRLTIRGSLPQKSANALCVFASYETSGVVAPYVVNYLKALRAAGFDIIFVQSSDQRPVESNYESITPLCRAVINRTNLGYDFVSWKIGLGLCDDLLSYQKLLITNDSIVGPFTSLESTIKEMSADPQALWGLTESLETGTPHLQSFFLFCQQPVISSRFFKKFWESVTVAMYKWQIVIHYEVGFSKLARESGISVRAWLPFERVLDRCKSLGSRFAFPEKLGDGELNPTLHAWDVLLRDMRFPFIKTELLRGNRIGLEGLDTWQDLVSEAPDEIINGALAYEESTRWPIPKREESGLPIAPSPAVISVLGARLYARLNHRYDQTRRFTKDIRRGDLSEIKRKLRKSGKLGWLARRLSPSQTPKTSPLSAREEYFQEARRSLDAFYSSDRSIVFPDSPSPQVTIILILFNKAELTYKCLESLAALTDEPPFHVLIIDNASSDDTQQLLSRVHGATIITNTENTGFLRACNQAAELVKSPAILFLNNDTILYPEAIRAAVENLEDPRVGAVGGRIVLPDGLLQEAGSIFFNDGTCAGYGRGLPPEADECMHRRSVDYCSGVFLMTPSKLFKEIGGFDMRYAPAYYEESDYCAQLQKRGLSVIYDPRIFVRHVEFGSAVRSAAAFSLMHTNREKFLEKNRELLAQKCPPGTPHYRARSIPSGRKRWLFLDDRVALPHMGAGYPRMNQIIHIIAGLERYDITIACTERLTADWKEIRRDIPLDIEVVDLTDATRRERFLRERLNDFDVVWVSRPANMQHIVDATTPDLLRHKNFVMVYDSEAIFADRALTEAKVFGLKTDKAKTLMQAELLNGSRADILVAVCQSDARRWQEVAKRNVIIVGIKAAVAAGPKNFSERRDMLFVGSLHGLQSPNADSLFWFMKYVMPRINKALPDVATHAVGYVDSGMMAYIGRNTRNFTLIGAVPEIRPFLLEHRLVIAPTRFAAGIPQKVYDAAVTGTPTVCSPLIASQMEWQDGAETLVGSIDDPQNFAEQCIKLYTDEALWNGIYDRSLASMQQYTSTYNLERGVHQVLDAIEQHIEKARQGTSSQCANAL